MPVQCSVYGCSNNNIKSCNVRFFSFPHLKTNVQNWIHRTGRANKINVKIARICSDHFSSSQYRRNLKYELLNLPVPSNIRSLKDDAVPDLLLPNQSMSTDKTSKVASVRDVDSPDYVPTLNLGAETASTSEASMNNMEAGPSSSSTDFPNSNNELNEDLICGGGDGMESYNVHPPEQQQSATSLPKSQSTLPENKQQNVCKISNSFHMTSFFSAISKDESFLDVTLTAEGSSIKAHKLVLSALSPYFSEVLKENPCTHPIIIMSNDVSFTVLSSLIIYIYRGEVSVPEDVLPSFLKTAQNLQINGLRDSNFVKPDLPLNSIAKNNDIVPSAPKISVVSHELPLESGHPKKKFLFFPKPGNYDLSNLMKKESNVPGLPSPINILSIASNVTNNSPVVVSSANNAHNSLSISSDKIKFPRKYIINEKNKTELSMKSASAAMDLQCVKKEIDFDYVDEEITDYPGEEAEPVSSPKKEKVTHSLSPTNSIETFDQNITISEGQMTVESYPPANKIELDVSLPKMYKCPYCANYVVPKEWNAHTVAKHPQMQSYLCVECYSMFTFEKDFIIHSNNCKNSGTSSRSKRKRFKKDTISM